MASDVIRQPISLPASADLSSYQYRIMKVDTNGQLALASAGGWARGVLQDKPTAQYRPGMVSGPGDITKCLAGGSITKGAFIMSTAAGLGVVATSGSFVIGQALDQVSSGEIFRMVQLGGQSKL